VRFETRDASKGLSEKFDLVFAVDSLHDAADPAGIVRGVRDALRPGGRFVVHTAPTREFMAVGQHLKRLIQRLKGEPVAPVLTLESELREAGHSNIHSRRSLTEALASAFPDPRVTYAFSDNTRGGRRLAHALGLVSLLGFNLWALVRREGGRA
jgi:SAM-dependent methyltransferase